MPCSKIVMVFDRPVRKVVKVSTADRSRNRDRETLFMGKQKNGIFNLKLECRARTLGTREERPY